MYIEVWDDTLGCWHMAEAVEWPRTAVDRRLLWRRWTAEEEIPVVAYCRRAVAKAKEMFEKEPLRGIRVVWTKWKRPIWQSGRWKIETDKYDFYPDPY